MNKPQDTAFDVDLGVVWNHSLAGLGSGFYTELRPTPLPTPYWVGQSAALGREIGLPPQWLDSPAALEALCGNVGLAGGRPLASVYSGHQFGIWAGQLGDGRAILLGETASGWELQLKGSGLTPYSRMGDGRAVLRSSIREFLCSEAMHALGIPTTRALCVVGSDAPVRREEVETAAIVTRAAPSFLRFGHFEHFSYNEQYPQLQQLADYVIDRFYPECHGSARLGGNPYAALLEQVSERTARMVAQWQAVGFCHGVMNTDNMSILGLTIDYGPFQFLDGYRPGHICNHSDHQGRYAFNKQPNIAYWNLYALGQALLPLIEDQELAIAALESYKSVFPDSFEAAMRTKMGLADRQPGDRELVEATLKLLAKEAVDYPIFWRRLSHWVAQADADYSSVRDLFLDREAFDAWLPRYLERLPTAQRPAAGAAMLAANPYVVLRNHLAEQAIRQAKLKDFSEVHTLLAVLQDPYAESEAATSRAGFPPDWAAGIEISCSS
jgi:uncharacterized protein YdiU (UPF0061 family)